MSEGTEDFNEAQRLFALCCLCSNLAAQATDIGRINRLWEKHSQYAHRFRRVAARVKTAAKAEN